MSNGDYFAGMAAAEAADTGIVAFLRWRKEQKERKQEQTLVQRLEAALAEKDETLRLLAASNEARYHWMQQHAPSAETSEEFRELLAEQREFWKGKVPRR